jgi:flagellar basal-body rod protein FlgB
MDELTSELTMLGKMMDAASLRTRVIANNLANVNTPGFTRSKVVFEEALGEAIKRGRLAEAKAVRPEVEPDAGGDVKADGNNVHLETEVADLVKASTLYNIVNRILSGKIKALRTAIEGR